MAYLQGNKPKGPIELIALPRKVLNLENNDDGNLTESIFRIRLCGNKIQEIQAVDLSKAVVNKGIFLQNAFIEYEAILQMISVKRIENLRISILRPMGFNAVTHYYLDQSFGIFQQISCNEFSYRCRYTFLSTSQGIAESKKFYGAFYCSDVFDFFSRTANQVTLSICVLA